MDRQTEGAQLLLFQLLLLHVGARLRMLVRSGYRRVP